MDADALIDRLAVEGPLLLSAAERAGWDAPVPGTAWSARELVTHVGGVHRWAAAVVGGAGRDAVAACGAQVGDAVPDDELGEWFAAGHRTLVEELRRAPDDLEAFTFLPADSPRHFWARRQAHETGIHRGDACAAAGEVPDYPAAHAQDGIAEMLRGFAARRGNAIAQGGTLALRATDSGAPWLITCGGERTVAAQGTGEADATVTGTSGELYLWLWNRPSGATVSGDEVLARCWGDTVRITWA